MKKLVALLLLVCLCVSLVACGKNAAAPTEPATEPSTQAAERTPVTPVSGDTPTLSNGSGCAGELSGGAE